MLLIIYVTFVPIPPSIRLSRKILQQTINIGLRIVSLMELNISFCQTTIWDTSCMRTILSTTCQSLVKFSLPDVVNTTFAPSETSYT